MWVRYLLPGWFSCGCWIKVLECTAVLSSTWSSSSFFTITEHYRCQLLASPLFFCIFTVWHLKWLVCVWDTVNVIQVLMPVFLVLVRSFLVSFPNLSSIFCLLLKFFPRLSSHHWFVRSYRFLVIFVYVILLFWRLWHLLFIFLLRHCCHVRFGGVFLGVVHFWFCT